MKALTPKEARFVAAYLGEADGNGARAAVLAGYAPRSASVTASRMLTRANIRAAIEHRHRRALESASVSTDRVIAELARIGFSDIRALVDETGRLKPLHELSTDAAAALASVEVNRERVRVKSTDTEEVTTEEATVKVRLWDKPAALTTLCRYLGILKDKVDHKHTFSLEDVLDASRVADGE